MFPFGIFTARRPTRMFTLSVGPPLHSHSGVHAAPRACSHVPPPHPHHPSGPAAMFLFSTFTVRRPTHMFNPPTPTIPAGPQPCSHLGHSPSAGPLVCSHTSVGTPLHSHSGVHAAPRACAYVSPTPTTTIPAGPQLCFHFGHVPSAGPLVCSYSQRARRCIPPVCRQLRGPSRMFQPPTYTIPAGPQLCFHFIYAPSTGPPVKYIPTLVWPPGPARVYENQWYSVSGPTAG